MSKEMAVLFFSLCKESDPILLLLRAHGIHYPAPDNYRQFGELLADFSFQLKQIPIADPAPEPERREKYKGEHLYKAPDQAPAEPPAPAPKTAAQLEDEIPF